MVFIFWDNKFKLTGLVGKDYNEIKFTTYLMDINQHQRLFGGDVTKIETFNTVVTENEVFIDNTVVSIDNFGQAYLAKLFGYIEQQNPRSFFG